MESIGVGSSGLDAIGGTPMIRLRRVVPRGAATVLVKLEGGNPTGSYKDRMALGREILAQTAASGMTIDAFGAAVGTAGMLVGVVRALRAAGSAARVVAFEPATSPTLTLGVGAPHRVEGTAAGIVPPLLTPDSFDEARTVDEEVARAMAIRLAREEGIFAGTSSALNVVGTIALAQELGADKTVVTVAVDTGMKYLAGDLFDAS